MHCHRFEKSLRVGECSIEGACHAGDRLCTFVAERVSAQSKLVAEHASAQAKQLAVSVGSQVELLATFVKAYAKLLGKYLAARAVVRSAVTSDTRPLDSNTNVVHVLEEIQRENPDSLKTLLESVK